MPFSNASCVCEWCKAVNLNWVCIADNNPLNLFLSRHKTSALPFPARSQIRKTSRGSIQQKKKGEKNLRGLESQHSEGLVSAVERFVSKTTTKTTLKFKLVPQQLYYGANQLLSQSNNTLLCWNTRQWNMYFEDSSASVQQLTGNLSQMLTGILPWIKIKLAVKSMAERQQPVALFCCCTTG